MRGGDSGLGTRDLDKTSGFLVAFAEETASAHATMRTYEMFFPSPESRAPSPDLRP